mmetsp:Transcript_72380/g.189705  ORF Transcript_72380/g.189705 Transcript_72380/m.189705 type:complete len:243 (+) Transcript_72380:668-1396(+)
MVPGPALVTITSHAAIHSSMFDTKPTMWARTLSGHWVALSLARAFSFLPQTTTRFVTFSKDSPISRPMAFATCCSFPTPSPPPTTSTVSASLCSPSSSRTCSRERFSGFQNSRRKGRPYMWIAESRIPMRRAWAFRSTEGTNTRSASGWNHIGCAPPKSVTTVTKGMRRRVRRAKRRRTLITICCVHGCNDTMRSGSSLSMAWRKARLHRTLAKRCEMKRVIGNLLVQKKMRQKNGYFAMNM